MRNQETKERKEWKRIMLIWSKLMVLSSRVNEWNLITNENCLLRFDSIGSSDYMKTVFSSKFANVKEKATLKAMSIEKELFFDRSCFKWSINRSFKWPLSFLLPLSDSNIWTWRITLIITDSYFRSIQLLQRSINNRLPAVIMMLKIIRTTHKVE